MPLSELAIKEKIGELQRESMSAAEKIIALEQKEQRERLIDWIKTDPEVKIIIAFSGGKDSIYMVLFYLYVLHIPPDRIELWHHDVDGHGEELFDWKSTPEYCMAFARAFNLKLLFSYRKGGIVGRLLRNNEPLGDVFYQSEPGGEFHCAKSDPNKLNTGGRWMQVGSDMKKRWCSSSVKIEVASRILTNDQRLQGSPERPVKIVFNTGERHDESTARKNLKEVEVYRGTRLVSTRNVILFRPNVSISEQQVWQMMKAHRVQPHPCYMIGWNRCSCQLCIFNSSEYWRSILDISPEKILRVRELEELTAEYPVNDGKEHTIYDGKTIFEKAILGDGIVDMSDPENLYWIKQATEKYTHPIIIDNWKMPKGALVKLNCGAT